MAAPPRGHRGSELRQGAALQANNRWAKQSSRKTAETLEELAAAVAALQVPSVVYANGTDTATTGNLSTTETAYVAATLTIPAEWSTYNIRAFCTLQLVDNSAGSTGAGQPVIARIRLTNASGTEFSPTGGVTLEVMDLNYHDTHGHAVNGVLEGLSATGSVVVNLTLQRSGATFNVVADQQCLLVEAVRTS